MVAALALLTACGPKAEAPVAASAAPPSDALAGGPVDPSAPAKPSPFPPWLTIALQAGGGMVQYHPASIQRDAKTGIADVWIQVTYGSPQKYQTEDKIAVQTITYQRERYLYRFDCNATRYAVMDRRIMGDGEVIAEDIPTVTKAGEIPWAEVRAGGVANLAQGPACKAVIAAP
jgi:hypothetical protein